MDLPPDYVMWLEARTAADGDCRMWAGWADRDGYGILTVGGRHWRAHRYAYWLASGVHPAGLMVLHACDRPGCCAIEHLRLGTAAENMADRVARRRDDRLYESRWVRLGQTTFVWPV